MRKATAPRRLALALTWVIVIGAQPRPALAQSLSRVSLDSVSSVDLFRGDGTTGRPGASVDISSVFRIGHGWSAHVRPWFFKSSADHSEWSKEIYQAALRYERPGHTSFRLDAGYIASPIGLGMLDMRADMNPTIQPHLSYFVPLLPFDRTAPTVGPITASYPLGANGTLSSRRWDARAALVNAAPTRRYALNAERPNPQSTPVLIAGGGVTPVVGLRVGTSLASGRYATPGEVSDSAGVARDLLMWTVEGEYAFAYTKFAAEFTREQFQHGAIRDSASTWFVQAMQTLSPRWFASGRHEGINAPPVPGSARTGPRLSFTTTEGSLGYRATPDLTLRASVTAQRWYIAAATDQRVAVQMVWSRRWY